VTKGGAKRAEKQMHTAADKISEHDGNETASERRRRSQAEG